MFSRIAARLSFAIPNSSKWFDVLFVLAWNTMDALTYLGMIVGITMAAMTAQAASGPHPHLVMASFLDQVTVGNVIEISTVLIGFVVTWTKMDMRLKQTEKWIEENRTICTDFAALEAEVGEHHKGFSDRMELLNELRVKVAKLEDRVENGHSAKGR